MANGDIMESRLPLRSVIQMFVVVTSAAGSCWYLASSFDHRLTSIENAVIYGGKRQDDQIKAANDLAAASAAGVAQQNAAIEALKASAAQHGGEIYALQGMQATDEKRLNTVICHVYRTGQACGREP